MHSSYTDPLSWDLFRVVHGDAAEDQFEALCKELFARRVDKGLEELVAYANQPGIEVEPVTFGGQNFSFQSKFSNSDKVSWTAFSNSLDKAIADRGKRDIALDSIIHYTNGSAAVNNKARDAIETCASEAGIDIVWVYGTELLVKLDEPANHDLRHKYFRGGKDLSLIIPSAPSSKHVSAIKYQVELIPFQGRENEIESLMEFTKSASGVSWTIVAGGGGLGKSRLALELCKRLRDEGWNAGFWTTGNLAGLQDWQPERDHFIVCDYLNDRDDEVVKLLQRAIEIPNETHRNLKIRILLLDREASTASVKLCGAQTIGPSIAAIYEGKTAIDLMPFTLDEVFMAIDLLAAELRLSEDFIGAIRNWIETVDTRRRLVLASLLCLHASELESTEITVDFTVLVHEILSFERQRWESLDFDSDAEDVLLLATMLGGISKHGLTLGKQAKSLVSTFKSDDVYETIVGEPTKDQLAPLSHDLVGELFVLDGLDADSSGDQEKFIKMMRVALDIDHGKGLVAFFTRAANDYPEHPTLGFLRTPFSNLEPIFSVWLLIIANVIDKMPATQVEKLELFQRTTEGILQLISPDQKYLDILRGFFLRLLYGLTRDEGLGRWVGEYRIVDVGSEDLPPATVPVKEQVNVGNQSISLLPLEYCNTVLNAFATLDHLSRKQLANPHLLEVFSDGLMQGTVTGSVNFQKLRTTSDLLFQSFDDNWMQGLISVVRNTLAALVNFNHARKQSDDVISFTNGLLDTLDERSLILPSAADCYMVASTVLRAAGADLESIQNLVERFDEKFPEEGVSQDEVLAAAYIGLTVAAMYGFRSEADYAIAHSRACTVLNLCNMFQSSSNVENSILAITQLLDYQGEFSSSAEKNQVLDWVLEHVSRYGRDTQEIVATLVRKLSSLYVSANTDDSIRQRLYSSTIDLIRSYESEPLGVSVYPGDLFKNALNEAFDDSDYISIRRIANDIAVLQELSYVDLTQFYMNFIPQEFLRRWTASVNSRDLSSNTEIALCAQYWLDTLPVTNHIEPVFRHIIDEYDRM